MSQKPKNDTPDPASQLGARLRDVRQLRGWSLHRAGDEAGISAAYLQKLERGQVHAPSPHKLHSLARAFEVPYRDLMRLAGYVVPDDAPSAGAEGAPVKVLAEALLAEDLDQEELQELASYLRWRREQKSGKA
jgi:transcriptional regulator with XRE-family HTH domain